MEEVPLRQDAENPPVIPGIQKRGTTPSKIVNKRTIVIGAIVIVVLVVLVITLGALLGAERAKRKGKLSFIGDHGVSRNFGSVRLILFLNSNNRY